MKIQITEILFAHSPIEWESGNGEKRLICLFFCHFACRNRNEFIFHFSGLSFILNMHEQNDAQVVPFSAKYCDPPQAFQAGPRLLGGPASRVWPLCELYATASFHSCSLFHLQTPTGFFSPSHPRGGSGSGIIWIITPIKWHFSSYCLLPCRKEKEAGCGCIQLWW